jgi:hypothetical protein
MNENQIHRYTRTMLKSEWTRVHPKLQSDLEYILSGGAVYLPNWFCSTTDHTLLQKLLTELGPSHTQRWSKHLKIENPQDSPTFQMLIQQMADHFGVDVYATRLNVYTDETAWKPYHHDSHAFANGYKEDFTMGASFGSTRQLSFKHPETEQSFEFPQNNGDVFAFDTEVNKRFMHGVPKSRDPSDLRISIIAWGKRRSSVNTNHSKQAKQTNSRPETLQPIPSKPTNALKARIQSRQRNTVQSGWATHPEK